MKIYIFFFNNFDRHRSWIREQQVNRVRSGSVTHFFPEQPTDYIESAERRHQDSKRFQAAFRLFLACVCKHLRLPFIAVYDIFSDRPIAKDDIGMTINFRFIVQAYNCMYPKLGAKCMLQFTNHVWQVPKPTCKKADTKLQSQEYICTDVLRLLSHPNCQFLKLISTYSNVENIRTSYESPFVLQIWAFNSSSYGTKHKPQKKNLYNFIKHF